MAMRFHQGGKLVVFGTGGPSTDAQHVAVEFVHPVIVGKRALPAISLTSDVATVTGVAASDGMAAIFAHQLRYLAAARGHRARHLRRRQLRQRPVRPGDRPRARHADDRAGRRATAARSLPARPSTTCWWPARPIRASSRRLQVTTYHVLWELVHVFFEQPGVLAPGVVSMTSVPECHDEVCITCSDTAVQVTVVRLLDDDLARGRHRPGHGGSQRGPGQRRGRRHHPGARQGGDRGGAEAGS